MKGMLALMMPHLHSSQSLVLIRLSTSIVSCRADVQPGYILRMSTALAKVNFENFPANYSNPWSAVWNEGYTSMFFGEGAG